MKATAVIAIVGRPNVGKSTLFNRITRSRYALVDDQPGVTRDRLHASVSWGDKAFIMIDTGGFDEADEEQLLKQVRAQVFKAVDEADRIVFVVSGRDGLLPGDEELADYLRRSGKTVFLAVNKIDGPEHENLATDFYRLGLEKVHAVSAAHGYGLRALMDEIVATIPPIETADQKDDSIRVAILGRPNVGKSSLINKILGFERMVVSDLPGTTRDAIDTLCILNDQSFLFIDTAGLRRKARVKEKIEKFSMIKALKSLDRCHIAVVTLDATAGVAEQDARICGYAFERGKGIILALNKWDLVKKDAQKIKHLEEEIDRQLHFVSFAPKLRLSAITGAGVPKLPLIIVDLYKQFSFRVATGSLNKAVRDIVESHPPPRVKNSSFKVFYATQAETKPPTFVVFANRPDLVHFSYQRFLINRLKENLGLQKTPIRVVFKKRQRLD
ncbi:MAG: ribosome biogenesis GTPase Der [Deltaproteobacteria bacterium]|nr:ribosome biogenesis GTPase Der [Deltaproteobacteria bacterium]